MTGKRRHFAAAALLGWLTVVGISCVSLKPPPDLTRHYLLNGPTDPIDLAASRTAPVVRLEPIELDPYLDTRYMVLRLREHEVQFSDIHRWGESLSDNIHRTLARHLLATGQVSAVVDSPSRRADYVVELHVHRFEGAPPNIAHVSATWRLRDHDGNLLHIAVFEDRNEGWRFENYGHLAEKLDESLGTLARVVAEQLRSP